MVLKKKYLLAIRKGGKNKIYSFSTKYARGVKLDNIVKKGKIDGYAYSEIKKAYK